MDAARQASLPSISRSLFKLISIESVMPSNRLILCHPLLLSSIFPSIRIFSSGSVLSDQVIVEQIDCIYKAIDQTATVVKLFHIELAVLGEIIKYFLFCDRRL